MKNKVKIFIVSVAMVYLLMSCPVGGCFDTPGPQYHYALPHGSIMIFDNTNANDFSFHTEVTNDDFDLTLEIDSYTVSSSDMSVYPKKSEKYGFVDRGSEHFLEYGNNLYWGLNFYGLDEMATAILGLDNQNNIPESLRDSATVITENKPVPPYGYEEISPKRQVIFTGTAGDSITFWLLSSWKSYKPLIENTLRVRDIVDKDNPSFNFPESIIPLDKKTFDFLSCGTGDYAEYVQSIKDEYEHDYQENYNSSLLDLDDITSSELESFKRDILEKEDYYKKRKIIVELDEHGEGSLELMGYWKETSSPYYYTQWPPFSTGNNDYISPHRQKWFEEVPVLHYPDSWDDDEEGDN